MCVYVCACMCVSCTVHASVFLSTAVCIFPQSASVVAFLALNAGSPPPVACDIGSWHPRVYSERRRTQSPPETFVLSKRGGVCPSKALGKLSTVLVKRLQTTLKTQPCPQQMFVLRRLCVWSIRIESLWRLLSTWATLLWRLWLKKLSPDPLFKVIFIVHKDFTLEMLFVLCLLQKIAKHINI